jgi:hypothetical protein
VAKKKAKKKKPSKAEKERKKREAAEKKRQGHIRLLGEWRCVAFRKWYDELREGKFVKHCLEETWIEMAGWVMQMAKDPKWDQQRAALTRGLKKRAEFFIKMDGLTAIGLPQLVGGAKHVQKRMRDFVEDGLGIVEAEVAARPGVIRAQQDRPEPPAVRFKNWSQGDIIKWNRKPRPWFGKVRKDLGRDDVILWVIPNGSGWTVTDDYQIRSRGVFRKCERLEGQAAQDVLDGWKALGRDLHCPQEFRVQRDGKILNGEAT